MSNIPEHEKNKIKAAGILYVRESFPAAPEKESINSMAFLDYTNGATFGYSLSLKELEEKDKRIKHLERMIKSAFERAYSLGYEAVSIGESYYCGECWKTFKQSNNL